MPLSFPITFHITYRYLSPGISENLYHRVGRDTTTLIELFHIAVFILMCHLEEPCCQHIIIPFFQMLMNAWKEQTHATQMPSAKTPLGHTSAYASLDTQGMGSNAKVYQKHRTQTDGFFNLDCPLHLLMPQCPPVLVTLFKGFQKQT